MFAAGTGFSKLKNAHEAARAAAKNALEQAGITRADAVIVFASSRYRRHFDSLLPHIHAVTGAQSIVGASGYGILTQDIEIERQSGIAVMVIASDEIQMEPFLVSNLQENNFAAGEAAGKMIRDKIIPRLVTLFPDSFSFVSPLFFDGFESACGYVPMIGGAAAEEGRDCKTFQFGNGRSAFDAVSGLAFGGSFRFETGITRSCRPFGESLKVTRAEGNAIYEVNGRPAYDMLLESISHIEFQDPDEIFRNIFIGVPLKNFQTDFSQDHPYLIRNIMNVNPKKGMFSCTSPVEEGEFITFTFRDAALARQDMRSTLEDLKNRLDGAAPLMGFYFNCCARGELLYGKSGQDAALIKSYFPNVPVLGFFSFGEIAPVDHVNHLHQHSGVLTLIARNS